MDVDKILDWLVPLSTAIALLATAVGVWLSLRDYRLKVKAQTADIDVQLVKLFTETMEVAHGRGGYLMSEEAIKILVDTADSDDEVRQKIDSALVTLPVGIAGQDAAIAAVWMLGRRHEQLLPVAMQALISLQSFKPKIATPYLNDLRLLYDGPVAPTDD